jgi:LuxR family maltose regulon positive regulatory protein
MANPSIISTKINIPRARIDVVMRPRVMKILDEGLERPSALMLISAPAGYGKTTLVLNWMHGLKQRTAWLSLEAEDDNLARFILYLVAALRKIHSGFGKQALGILESSSVDSFPADAISSSLIPDLSKLPKPVVIVLDDYHVIESEVVHAFVENLIEHGHQYLHVIITTRNDPPLPLARWRARDQLTEIRTADLQFTVEEATEFLEQVMQLKLSLQQIHLLAERTEGWVAGLQLAGLSIRNQRNKSNTLTIEGSHRDIADYLMLEVLKQLPKPQREFLLQTSIVNRLGASLCNSVTGRDDSQSMLEAFETDNLFIVALDDKREWFRYHHLFAEFLRKLLQAEYPENTVNGLHQRASHWFAKHADILSAIDHALSAKDYEYAACLIAPQSQQWMQRGEISTILKYLNQLPEDLVWNQWDLCLWYGWSYAVSGALNHAERWTNRLEMLITPLIQDATQKESGPVPPELQNAYVQVLAIRSSIARQNRDYVSAVALSNRL